MANKTEREVIAHALVGHRVDTMSQDSGQQCMCGSDSRFDQISRPGGRVDPPWNTIYEHQADLVLHAINRMIETQQPGRHAKGR